MLLGKDSWSHFENSPYLFIQFHMGVWPNWKAFRQYFRIFSSNSFYTFIVLFKIQHLALFALGIYSKNNLSGNSLPTLRKWDIHTWNYRGIWFMSEKIIWGWNYPRSLSARGITWSGFWEIYRICISGEERKKFPHVLCHFSRVWLYRLYLARLLCPWDCLGRNTGTGCHFLLKGIFQPRDQTHLSSISCIGRWALYH